MPSPHQCAPTIAFSPRLHIVLPGVEISVLTRGPDRDGFGKCRARRFRVVEFVVEVGVESDVIGISPCVPEDAANSENISIIAPSIKMTFKTRFILCMDKF